jgi:hypothetical protein
MNAYGLVPKILDKITEAQQPERFTQDYLSTKLGFSGGSARVFIPLLKRIGFLSSDGVPTALYAKFRNGDTRGAAMAQALRIGYKELFERNEYAQDLPREKLKNLTFPDIKAVEVTLARLNTLRAPIAHCSMLAEDEVMRLHLSLRDWFRLME